MISASMSPYHLAPIDRTSRLTEFASALSSLFPEHHTPAIYSYFKQFLTIQHPKYIFSEDYQYTNDSRFTQGIDSILSTPSNSLTFPLPLQNPPREQQLLTISGSQALPHSLSPSLPLSNPLQTSLSIPPKPTLLLSSPAQASQPKAPKTKPATRKRSRPTPNEQEDINDIIDQLRITPEQLRDFEQIRDRHQNLHKLVLEYREPAVGSQPSRRLHVINKVKNNRQRLTLLGKYDKGEELTVEEKATLERWGDMERLEKNKRFKFYIP
jgi:hypothetical protein